MSNAYSGVEANVNFGSKDPDVQGWTADHEVTTFDSTTTADLGWEDTTGATQKLTGSFDFLWNPAKAPFGSLGVKAGATGPMILYVSKTDNVQLAGNGLITKVSIKTKTKEGVLLTATFNNKGPWTLPT